MEIIAKMNIMRVNTLEIFAEHRIDVAEFIEDPIIPLLPINNGGDNSRDDDKGDGGDDDGGDNGGGNGSQSDEPTGFNIGNDHENNGEIGRDNGVG